MKRLDRYRVSQALRRIADRVDGGLHQAFMDDQQASDIYDALRTVEDEVAGTPSIEVRSTGSPEDFARILSSGRYMPQSRLR